MKNTKMAYVPNVIEQTEEGKMHFDLFSRLVQDRIVLINDEVNDASMSIAIASLLFLNNQDKEKPIYLYVMSGGGSCYSGLALMDIMNFISAPVYTIALGYSMSMGAAILSSGEKGHRYALPYSTVMIHQASSGAQGNVQDIEVSHNETKRLNDLLAGIIAQNCGKKAYQYKKDTNRDLFLSSTDALEYGIIDEILYKEDHYGIKLPDWNELNSKKPDPELKEKFKEFLMSLNLEKILNK